MTDTPEPSRPSLKQVIFSVLAAGFGVQSDKNLQRDFSRGSGKQFVAVGLIATAVFVLTIYLIVQLILNLVAV